MSNARISQSDCLRTVICYSTVLRFWFFFSGWNQLDNISAHRNSPELYWKLRLEEIRLMAWGRYWGLDDGKFDSFLEDAGLREDVCGILCRMKELLQNTESMSTKYGIIHVEGEGSSQLETGDARVLKKTHKLVSKFKWAFTDKTKFQTMITDLQDFNNGLHSLLRLENTVPLASLLSQNPSASQRASQHSFTCKHHA